MNGQDAHDPYGASNIAESVGGPTNGVSITNGAYADTALRNNFGSGDVHASEEAHVNGDQVHGSHGTRTVAGQAVHTQVNGIHVDKDSFQDNAPPPSTADDDGASNAETASKVEPLAIIGLACRLPGDVKDATEFWEMCARRRNGWSEIPASRFNAASFYHPNPGKAGTFNPTGGNFIQQDFGLFDAPFFKISSQEAQSIDPQQRILLECAYEALENGGIAKEAVTGDNVGVFIGSSFVDYEMNNLRDTETIPMYQATGNGASILSNRISYYFNLKGPSISVDTACSSSLVALHLACQSLRSGESSQALVGGCHLNLTPEYFISMSMLRLFSDTGRCDAFDQKGQSGFGRGDGAGMILLKRLDDAIRDGDPIRALIVGSGVNQDGATQGMPMPSGTAQESLIRSVYKSAQLDPRDTGYVEAHGTGTKVGDPIEASALHAVFDEGRTKRQPLYIGSVKSNVGHSEGASGVVSVIKTAMMLDRGFILPTCNFEKAKENIPLDTWNMKVPIKQIPWPTGKKYASVSSFGFGGTNAHVVLARVPINAHLSAQKSSISPALEAPSSSGIKSPSQKVFVLSGNDEQAARTQAKNLEIYCEQNPAAFDSAVTENLAFTLGQRRSHLDWKISVTASSASELVGKLSTLDTKPIRSSEPPVLGFVFTGQGAQWHAMGRELMTSYPVFADAMFKADDLIARLGSAFSIVEELSKQQDSSSIASARVSQPACTAVQIALTDLLRSWGIHPRGVVGHSSGEIGAAYAARRLSFDDCISIAYWRGAISQRLEEASSAPIIAETDSNVKQNPSYGAKGAMLAVGANEATVVTFLKSLRHGRASIACINSDNSMTVSGDEEAIVELQDALSEQSIFNRRLQVGVAYHSHHMKCVAEEYHDRIRHVAPQDSDITFHSSVCGRLASWKELGVEYWVGNLLSPVRFSDGLRDLLANCYSTDGQRVQTLIEVGPHPALEGPVKQTLKIDKQEARTRYVPTLRRKVDAVEAVQQLAGTLFGLGSKIDLGAVNFPVPPERKLKVITNLPRYPWTLNTRYWHESRISRNFLHRQFPRSDLLGSLCTETDDIEPRWRNIICADDLPWISDHRVQGKSVYPMAGYIVMAIEAANQHAKMRNQTPTEIFLREVTAGKALVIPESSKVELMLTLRPYTEGTRTSSDVWNEFRVLSWAKEKGWDEHCRGLISVQSTIKPNALTHPVGLAAAETTELITSTEACCSQDIGTEAIYSSLEEKGFVYDGLFKRLHKCRVGKQRTIVDFNVPTTKHTMPFEYESDYIIHPTTLDLCIQNVWPLLGAGGSGLRHLHMPTFLKSLKISFTERIPPKTALRVYGSQCERESRLAPVDHDFTVHDINDPERLFMRFEGLTMTPVRDDIDVLDIEKKRNLCYRLELEPHLDFLNAEEILNSSSSIRHGKSSNITEKAGLCIQRMIRLNPQMSILEIDASDCVNTLPILENLGGGSTGDAPLFNTFTYTNESKDLLETAKTRFGAWDGLVDFKTLDISTDPTAQGFVKDSVDLLIVCCPLDWLSAQREVLMHARVLLKSGGKLLIVDDALRNNGHPAPTFSKETWTNVLRETDFTGVDIHLDDWSEASKEQSNVIVTTAKTSLQQIEEEIVLVRSESSPEFPYPMLADGIKALNNNKDPAILSLADVDAKGKICVVLYEINGPQLSNLTPDTFSALQRMILSASGILWVVCDASDHSPEANLATGLARAARSELGLRFATLDLGTRKHLPSDKEVNQILGVFSNVFGETRSVLDQGETEFLVREDTVSVPRIVEDVISTKLVNHRPGELLLHDSSFRQVGRPLKMAFDQPGLLDTLYYMDDEVSAKPLPVNYVEIQIQYAGLNFKDVMNAMGQLHSDNFGLECSGTVSRVGSEVTEFNVGDSVCAVADSTLANFTRCQASSAWKVPEVVGMEAASTIPIVFCTAYYSLVHVARLSAGEKVLIHAAAGGVGQAAIMIAQSIGAEIFVTVGSVEKKKHLTDTYNIPENKIFFSRDLSFADGIRSATKGVGVDVALNSLAGEALQATWECMAPLGRFIEIGKRDIKRNSRLEMSRFDDNVTFASVDLMVIVKKRPSLMKRLLSEVFAMFQTGELKAVSPRSCYSVSETYNALSSLQSGRAMGKVCIKMEDSAQVKVNMRNANSELFRADASYLIVGGTGGLGRYLATWMAENGARHLVLVSRSGGDPDTMQDLVKRLQGKGCQAVVCACDMSSKRSVDEILEPALKSLPTVAGAVYGAMVLRDVLFETMSYSDYDAVIKPKVDGVWNLHNCLSNRPLEFFITISSLAGIVGNRGQAAYAATATFMDAFVQYRKTLGLPCTTIDLAPVAGIGYLAENSDKQKLVTDAFGGAAVDEDEISGLFSAAVRNELEKTCNGQCITGLHITETNSNAFWMKDRKFAILQQNFTAASKATLGGNPQREVLQSLPDTIKQQDGLEGVKKVVLEGLTRKVSTMLMRAEDDISKTVRLATYGMDSLVAIEFRSWIARELGAGLQILEILATESMTDLADMIIERSKLISDDVRNTSTAGEETLPNGTVNGEDSVMVNGAN